MKKRGLSLVEILIAAAILLAAMIPLWGLMGTSHKQVIRSADEVKASQLAVEILEQLENSHNLECLPKDESNEYSFNSEGVATVGGAAGITLHFGKFDEYLMPKFVLSSSPVYNKARGDESEEIGRIVSVTIIYNSKEKRDLEYVLRGFVSAN